MQCISWDIRIPQSCSTTRMQLYLLDCSPELAIQDRAMVIVCPGGGYHMCSDREAESIALQYNAMGYHAAVLYYSIAPAVFPTAMAELGQAVAECRKHAAQWHIDPDSIIINGFSAGGHLAASYSVNWDTQWFRTFVDAGSDLLKPNGLILGYPVILAGETEFESCKSLFGEAYPQGLENAEIIGKMTQDFPRTFIWTTFEDDLVSVQHSLALAQALAQHKIPAELHAFEKGPHGLALSNRITERTDGFGINHAAEKWIDLVRTWLSAGTSR